MPSLACGGFKLLPVVSEQMLSSVRNDSTPLPVVLEQMPLQEPLFAASEQMSLPVTQRTEQESSPTASEQMPFPRRRGWSRSRCPWC